MPSLLLKLDPAPGIIVMLCLNSVGLLLDIIEDYEATLPPGSLKRREQSLNDDGLVAEDEDTEEDEEDDGDLDDDEEEDDLDEDDEDDDDLDDEWEEVGDEDDEDEDDEDEESAP